VHSGICWLDGKIHPVHEAKIPVLDHGLLYGDGVFEGIRFYNDKPFLIEKHLSRLFDSAQAIALEAPWSKNELIDIIQDVVNTSDLTDGYIRVIITRGEGALGIDPQHCKHPRLIVIADSLQMVNARVHEKGANLIIASTRRLPPDGLDPRIKSLNYLNHILARIEANYAGVDEAILLNRQGNVAEGSADNISGITRELILNLASKIKIETREQQLAPYDLYTADECFLTGTGAELIPVRSIDGRILKHNLGPQYKKLKVAFTNFILSA